MRKVIVKRYQNHYITSSVELNHRPNPNKEFLLTLPNPFMRTNLLSSEINNFSDLKMLRSSSICASPVYRQAFVWQNPHFWN